MDPAQRKSTEHRVGLLDTYARTDGFCFGIRINRISRIYPYIVVDPLGGSWTLSVNADDG